jgi:hypothetical protein
VTLDGISHFDDLIIEMQGDPRSSEVLGVAVTTSEVWLAQGMQFREVSGRFDGDFHVAPRRQLIVTLTRIAETEASDGLDSKVANEATSASFLRERRNPLDSNVR